MDFILSLQILEKSLRLLKIEIFPFSKLIHKTDIEFVLDFCAREPYELPLNACLVLSHLPNIIIKV